MSETKDYTGEITTDIQEKQQNAINVLFILNLCATVGTKPSHHNMAAN